MRCKYAEKLADTLMKRYPKADQYPYKSWTYPQGFMLWGMARLWQKNGEQKYYDYIMEYVNGHINADGKIPKFTGNSMDDMMAGSIIVWAYQQTKEPCFKKACEQIREAFCDYPRNNNGGFWHGKTCPTKCGWTVFLWDRCFFPNMVLIWLPQRKQRDALMRRFGSWVSSMTVAAKKERD